MKVKKTRVPFSKLPSWQKRVVIAKDVIELIAVKVARVRRGTYLSLIIDDAVDGRQLIGEQLNGHLNKEEVRCEVCAKGALLLSHINRNNNYRISPNFFGDIRSDELNSQNAVMSRLSGIFYERQLNAIETAFEKGVVILDSDLVCGKTADGFFKETDFAKDCIAFGKKYKDDKRRLIGIMNNVIKNKGQFIPPPRPARKKKTNG